MPIEKDLYMIEVGGIRMKLRINIFILLLCLLLSGCSPGGTQVTKESEQETADLNSQQDLLKDRWDREFSRENIIISISPDQLSYYCMQPASAYHSDDFPRTIKGAEPVGMNLYRVDSQTGVRELIIADFPVVTLARWNPRGTMLAMMGGRQLIIYDAEKNSLIMQGELENEQVSYFGWSSDGTIYTELPDLPNGSIIFPIEEIVLPAYETYEEVYYKYKIDNDLSYGTWVDKLSNEELKQYGGLARPVTVIARNDGTIIKKMGYGRFRDACGNSILQVGENLFGLYYTPDVENAENIITLSEEYIYGACFAWEGKIAYLVQSDNREENNFVLCIADRNGEKIKEFDVTGSNLLLSPGKEIICAKGGQDEEIDLTTLSLMNSVNASQLGHVEQEIYRTIRGAMDTYCKWDMIGESDWQAVDKYFIDTHEPEQWAWFDIMHTFKETAYERSSNKYFISLALQELEIEGNRASTVLNCMVKGSSGCGSGQQWALELIEENGRWQVTGLSTFPDSQPRREIESLVSTILKKGTRDSIFQGQLNGREVSMGQIQFWQLSSPQLAADVEKANYCKVYLKVQENEKESIYKLIFRKDQNYWVVNTFTKENLSSLF